jgi:hypothetical protein
MERVMKGLLTFGLGAALLLAAAVAFTQDKPATAASPMPTLAQMDERMQKMQALHDKMMNAATPEERRKAMEDARREMQNSMGMMKPMMQGGPMMGGGMMGEKDKSGNAQAQMRMMGKRMDMMQMMMQMMIDQQGMMMLPKPVDAAPNK